MGKMNRRDFLKGTLASLAMAGFAKPSVALAQLGGGSNRNLIVLFQRGGSDGFYTCPPISGYVQNFLSTVRSETMVGPANAIFTGGFASAQNGLPNQVGLHPSFQNLANEVADNLKIIRGTGTPTYINGSHEGMTNVHHIGHSVSSANAKGWFAKLKEVGNMSMWQAWGIGGFGSDVRFATTEGERPLVLSSLGSYNFADAAMGNYKSTQWYDDRWHRRQVIETIAGQNNPQAAIEHVFQAATDQMHSSISVVDLIDDNVTVGNYTSTYGFARNCRDTAKVLIHKKNTPSLSNSATIMYLEYGGWDSHGDQNDNLPNRIADMGNNLAALVQDLKAQGLWTSTTILMDSEFGRTIRENGGQGTDHAWGNTNLVFGGSVIPGLVGDPPTLSNLQNSNRVTPNIDYRAPIEACIAWLGYDPALIFNEPHDTNQWQTLNLLA